MTIERTTAPRSRFNMFSARWQSLLWIGSVLLCHHIGVSGAKIELTDEATLQKNDRTEDLPNRRAHRREMVGAYFPADPKDPFVQEAARFCAKQLSAHETTSTKEYSFASTLSDLKVHYHVVQAQQQVVAGRNYKLVIELVQSNKDSAVTNKTSCVGGFHVVIYDHFGELSITHWGDEVSCKGIQKLKEMSAGEDSN